MKEKTPQTSCQQPNRGISVITPLPFWGGVGGGATILWARNVRQKGSVKSVKSVSSVRERPHHAPCKQPNRGNLTYYAPPCGGGEGGGATILWARNCAPKISVNSVCSVREKTPQRVVCVLSHTSGCVLFLTENTEEQNTQHSTETLSQPISQSVTANVS